MDPLEAHILAKPLDVWADRTPHAVAVEDAAGRTLSYAELARKSNQMAASLVASGVGRGDRVGICMPKSINSLIAVYGTLKAQAAYIPLDFSAPSERNQFIAQNCQMRAICVDEPRLASLRSEETGARPLVFPGSSAEPVGASWLDAHAADSPSTAPEPSDLAYILYTSGSTGVPKGVVHTHASATSFVRWGAETFRPTGEDRFSSHAPFHFDLSIFDLYVPAVAGARVVIVDESLGKDPRQLAPFIAEKRISVWYSVPSVLTLLAIHGNLDQFDYSALRLVLFAGEVFPVKYLRQLKQLWPEKPCYNLYGPTETNVCTFYRIPDQIDERRTQPFAIGRACSNVEAVAVDEDMRPIGGSGDGQLLVHQSGPVMQGYWNLPEQSQAAFHIDADGRRWYRTGDVVSNDDDGNYVFIGRRDRMVKRRGYRIELGEIESALYRHPQVSEVASVAIPGDEGVTIVACLSTKDGKPMSIIDLKQFCADNLPLYMSPDRFEFLEKLPRTSTDKVDYQALLGKW